MAFAWHVHVFHSLCSSGIVQSRNWASRQTLNHANRSFLRRDRSPWRSLKLWLANMLFLPTWRCLFALIAVILKKLKRTSCLALSSKYHTLSPVMTSALARRSRESKSEKLSASVCATRQKRMLRWAKKRYSLEEKNITIVWRTGTPTNRATAVNVNRLWERRRTGRELRDSVGGGRCVLLGIHCMHSLATGSRRPRCMWRNLAGRHFLTGASEPLWWSSNPSVNNRVRGK